jgi:hypothetical protein
MATIHRNHEVKVKVNYHAATSQVLFRGKRHSAINAAFCTMFICWKKICVDFPESRRENFPGPAFMITSRVDARAKVVRRLFQQQRLGCVASSSIDVMLSNERS